jgi:predicted MFS family arabinose efflux permease
LSSAASRTRRLLPLVLATTATQSSIVVLTPIVVAVSRDLDVSVSAVGQARTVLAAFACVAALRAGALIDRFGVRATRRRAAGRSRSWSPTRPGPPS